ncbi:TIGR04283 family arsenosugar biosynthesis glycosyltransferase [Candidatus Altiarchaeota archaeon]
MISIIIPVVDEAKIIGDALSHVQELAGEKEVIVADGGSTDGTGFIAAKKAFVVASGRGRGVQMNEGVKASSGDILLFLHADCRLADNALERIQSAVDDGYVGGCFTLYSGDSLRYGFLDSLSRLKTLLFREYYGDQGIFATRKAFDSIGGFPDAPLMEDVEFSKRLMTAGPTIQLGERIHADPRRFHNGFSKTLLNMILLRGLYKIGVDPDRMSKHYLDVR